MNTSDRVKMLITKQKQTQKKFAEIIGISPARLNNYLAGLSKVPQDILIKISEKYGCSLTWLLTGEGEMFQPSVIPAQAGIQQTKLITIPVSAPIAAGAPIQVVPDDPLEVIQVPASMLHLPPPYFAFRVEGDSMSPFIIEGDTIILSRDWRGLKLNERICGFRTPDGITLKKLILQPRQKTAWLMPLNHNYQPTPYNKDTEELILFGVLTLQIRRF